MDAYCQRQGLSANNVRFLFDGERLHETQTPKELNMENGDEIDVLVEQVGGYLSWSSMLIPIRTPPLSYHFYSSSFPLFEPFPIGKLDSKSKLVLIPLIIIFILYFLKIHPAKKLLFCSNDHKSSIKYK